MSCNLNKLTLDQRIQRRILLDLDINLRTGRPIDKATRTMLSAGGVR